MHINAGLNIGSTSSRRRLREGTMDQASTLLVILWFPTKPFQKGGFCLNMGVSEFHLLLEKTCLASGFHFLRVRVFPLTGTFIPKKGNGRTSCSCTEFFPHGHLYCPKENERTSFLPTLFPSWTPLFPKRGMEGHFSPTPSFSLTGTFIP